MSEAGLAALYLKKLVENYERSQVQVVKGFIDKNRRRVDPYLRKTPWDLKYHTIAKKYIMLRVAEEAYSRYGKTGFTGGIPTVAKECGDVLRGMKVKLKEAPPAARKVEIDTSTMLQALKIIFT
jgi:hypothetical protein